MKLSELTQDTVQVSANPKMKLSDVVRNSAMTSNRNNPDMKGGANAPANLLARKKLDSRKLKDEMLDIPIAPLAAANQFAGDLPRMATGGKFPTPITSGGKAISDVGGAAGMMASPVYRAEAFGAGKVLGAAGKAIGKVLPESVTGFAKPLEDRIYNLYNSAIGSKIKNLGDVKKLKGDRVSAMKAIHENLPNLKLQNPETGQMESRVPQNRLDLAHALNQTKQAIWAKVSDLSQGASDRGATIDLGKIVEKAGQDAKKSIGGVALKSNPGLASSIDQAVANIRMAGERISPSESQEYMKYLNSEVQRLRSSGQAVDFSTKDLYSNLLHHLNEETDSAIEKSLDKGGYRDLRRQYGALKSSEKEIINSANKYIRTGGNSSHYLTNLWSLEDAMQGLGEMATGHPAVGASRMASGAAIKGASKLMDYMKSPDRKITEIFNLISKNPASQSVIKNLDRTGIEDIGKLSEEPMVTKRPNQYVKTSQKEWPETEKYRDGIPLSMAGGEMIRENTLGQKNNNPGNLKATEKWQGMTGKDKFGHAQFKTKELGERALIKDLQSHRRKHMNQSLKEFMNTYAKRNGPQEAEFIAKHLGVDSNSKLKDINVYKMSKYLAKIESKMDISDNELSKVKKDYNL